VWISVYRVWSEAVKNEEGICKTKSVSELSEFELYFSYYNFFSLWVSVYFSSE